MARGVLTFLLRLVLLAAGLVFAASLLVLVAGLLVLWILRSAWARLTGQPVSPFVIRIDPRSGFSRVYRARQGGVTPQPQPVRPGRQAIADVVDVEAKPPRG